MSENPVHPQVHASALPSADAAELEAVTKLFHRLNRVLPEQQEVLWFTPDVPARDAVAQLRRKGFSQAPVIAGGTVIGVFSHRQFAAKSASFTADELIKLRSAPGDLPVEEFVEKFEFARVGDEIVDVFRAIDRDNGVLVGSPENLQGVLTPMDILKYLYSLANPFVLLSEIELALRALMRRAVDAHGLADCARRSLKSLYKDEAKIPVTLEAMTFDNYRMVITNGENWPVFSPFFGVNRDLTSGKLQQVGDLRNDVFHFKRDLVEDDLEILKNHRDWLMMKAQQVDAQGKAAGGAK